MNKDEQARLKKKQEAFRQQLQNDYEATFKTEHGRRVLNDIAKRGKFFSTSFTGNSETFKNEGMRAIVLYIFSAIAQNNPNIIAEALQTNEQIKQAWFKI